MKRLLLLGLLTVSTSASIVGQCSHEIELRSDAARWKLSRADGTDLTFGYVAKTLYDNGFYFKDVKSSRRNYDSLAAPSSPRIEMALYFDEGIFVIEKQGVTLFKDYSAIFNIFRAANILLHTVHGE